MPRRAAISSTTPWLALGLVLLLGLVSLVGLCCALHGHADAGHHGAAALDLCIGMIGVSIVSAPFVARAVIGRALVSPPVGLVFSPLEVRKLPPKR